MDHSKISLIHGSEPRVPGYLIAEKIGEGGMAQVYLATQESLDRTVALKILKPSMTANDPSISERFLKEGKIVAQLNHPNIVTLFDIGKAGALYYMAMEYVSGGSLKERIENQISIQDPLGIIRQIAKALSYAHQHDVVHRDVKPGNILFREDGSAVLSDFGIAKALTSHTSLTLTGFAAGTPLYMSPEQARGESVDLRSDLYSLGIVFYEILTREKPFKAEDPFATVMCHMNAPIPLLPEQFSLYQPVINRLLAKDADDRYMSADSLIKALDRAKSGVPHWDEGTELATELSESARGRTRIQERRRSPASAGTKGPGKETRPQHARRITDREKQSPFIRPMRSWRWPFLAALLTAVAIGGYLWLSTPRVDPQTRWIVTMMLEKASRQLEDSKLTEPVGDNAYTTYREVLEIIPNNDDALRGLNIVASRLQQQALDRQSQGDYERSLALIEKGLSIAPDNEELQKHKLEVAGLLEERRLEAEISDLLAQAESYISESRYTEPSTASAYQVYQSILAMDPDNKDALNGLHNISEHYARQAATKEKEGQLQAALSLAIKGLQIAPENRDLITLKDRITGSIKLAELKATIADLHSSAEKQLINSKLITPPGDNAYDTYQKILMLDSRDTEALDGIDRVRSKVRAAIEDKKLSGDYEQALLLVDRSLHLLPDDKEMLATKTSIDKLREERQRLEKIQNLERLAHQQMMESKLLSPSNDNAYSTYQDVLALDPENKNAKKGLDEIASKVIELVRSDVEKGLLREAIGKLDTSLDYYPNNPAVLRMRAEVAALLEKQLIKKEIENLTSLAKKQLAASKYTSPADDNAYATLQKLEALDPGNREAANGLRLIAAHYITRAQQEAKGGHLSDALIVMDQGLKVFPESQEMLSLRSAISQKIEEQDRRQQQVRELEQKAHSQVMQSRFVRPDGNNALETYRAILAIDPGNGKARAGLEELVSQIEQAALRNQQAANFEESLALITDGLEIKSEHSGLLKLRDEVSVHLDSIKQQEMVKALLVKAGKLTDAGRLTAPKGDNAYETYEEVLALDPGNQQAEEGIGEIPKRYAELIHHRQSQGAYLDGLSMAEEALQTFPGDSQLEDLKRELETQRATQQQDEAVDVLLAGAKKQVAGLRLTSPEGDNAYESYIQVLAMEPDNIAAKKGINGIADRYASLARSHHTKGDDSRSLAMIEKGLKIDPQHTALLKLKDQIVQARKSAEVRRQTVDALLRKAESQFRASRIVEPAGDNAHGTYLEILEIDSGNEQARRGVARIVQHFERLARSKRAGGDLSGGLHYVNKALRVAPTNTRLLALRTELDASLRDEQQKEKEARKIEDLLAQAGRKLASGQLIQPSGSSALAIYRKVQKMDPDNAQARGGIDKIAADFERKARTKQNNGELQDSLSIVDEGLRYIPEDATLSSLKGELMRAIAAQEKAERDRKKKAPVFGTF